MMSEATLNDPQKLLNKTMYLLWYKALSQRNGHAWMVDGITGTHLVEVSPDGKVTCDCKGYEIRGVCSHAVAVTIIIEKERLEKK